MEINRRSYPSSTEVKNARIFVTATHIRLPDVAHRHRRNAPSVIGIIADRISEGQSLASGRRDAYDMQHQFD